MVDLKCFSAIVFAECKALSNNDNGDDIKMIMRGNTVYNNWNRIPFYMTSGKIPPNGNPKWKLWKC